MKSNQIAKGFLSLAYKDYLASRFLINNGFIIQGVVLASSAIEKYLKVILALHDIYKKIHLDRLEELKSWFKKTDYHVLFDKFDPVFLDILGKAYKYRYYDENTVKEADTIGFIVHQFLGELDYTVFLINKLVTITDKDNKPIATSFSRDIESQNPNLFLNNYLLNKIPKKEFMDRVGKAYGIHVNPKFLGTEIEINGTWVQGEYDGRMWIVNVTNK
ncbi:MAG: hypothetical protein JNK14_19450 [Chitinophagaceae bacterium]|nr:hypothetical protein [Chitinophagaceae bacterium]